MNSRDTMFLAMAAVCGLSIMNTLYVSMVQHDLQALCNLRARRIRALESRVHRLVRITEDLPSIEKWMDTVSTCVVTCRAVELGQRREAPSVSMQDFPDAECQGSTTPNPPREEEYVIHDGLVIPRCASTTPPCI